MANQAAIDKKDVVSMKAKLLARKDKAVTDLHLVATALHPTYVHTINSEEVYEKVVAKLREVAGKRQLDESEIVREFGDFFHKVICQPFTRR